MAFWGVEVKPGRPFTRKSDGGISRLHVSQASLGNGTASTKSTLQCVVGNKSPVTLCILFPNASEVCQMNVEYQETEDVLFSVIGPRSVHICGYYLDRGGNHNFDDDSESYGEDVGATDSDRSNHDDDEDGLDDSFINDSDPGVMSASPVSSDGVEEVKPHSVKRKGHYRRFRKTYQLSDSDDSSSSDNHTEGNGDAGVDSEDLLPISSLCNKKLSARIENEADLTSNKLESEEQPGGLIDGHHRSRSDEFKIEMIDKSKQEKLHEADGAFDFFSKSILKWPKLEEKEEKDNKVGNDVSLFKDLDEDTGCRWSPPKQTDLQKSEKRKRKRKLQVEENASQSKCDNSSTIKEDGENQELKAATLDDDLPLPAEQNMDTSFPISLSLAVQAVAEYDQEAKKPKKRKIHELGKPLKAGVSVSSEDDAVEIKSSEEFGGQSVDENPEEGKKIKSKRQQLGKRMNAETPVLLKGEENQPANIEEGVAETKLPHVQAFPGGLLVEELEQGKMKGRVAAPGRKIKVSYTCKWKSTGEVCNSNIDGRSLKLVLGGEQVMEAWNVGLNGMRVRELRRLTIPGSSCLSKSSGNGEDGGEVITTTIPTLPLDCDVDDKSEGSKTPWLVYDVKLLKVYK